MCSPHSKLQPWPCQAAFVVHSLKAACFRISRINPSKIALSPPLPPTLWGELWGVWGTPPYPRQRGFTPYGIPIFMHLGGILRGARGYLHPPPVDRRRRESPYYFVKGSWREPGDWDVSIFVLHDDGYKLARGMLSNFWVCSGNKSTISCLRPRLYRPEGIIIELAGSRAVASNVSICFKDINIPLSSIKKTSSKYGTGSSLIRSP